MEKKIATDTPLYRHDAAYAREHDELPLYRESYQANIACKEAIEEAISENYGNNRLNSQAVFDAVSAEFSMERIQYVLANTVQYKDWDGRISRANREWAQTVPVVPNPDSWGGDARTRDKCTRCHAESRFMGRRPQLLFCGGQAAYRSDGSVHYPFPKGTGESPQSEKAVCSGKAPEAPAGRRAETRQG